MLHVDTADLYDSNDGHDGMNEMRPGTVPNNDRAVFSFVERGHLC